MPPLRQRLSAALAGKFQRDALWNFGSVAVLGLCGFAVTMLIGRRFGAAPLGVFNQAWAAYIFFSQAAVGGIDRSIVRAMSQHRGDGGRVSAVIRGAVAPTLLLALGFSALFWVAREPIAAWLKSPGVAEAMAWATPGLFFFALNKVGMAVVNAAERMRAFAVYTSLRYLGMLGGLVLVIALELPSNRIAFLFTFAEAVLFVPLAVEVVRQLRAPAAESWRAWSSTHLRYGVKSVASGMLLELNSRVDVLLLGRYLADGPVGVYSFAAQVAEGVYQVLVVLQNNYNPLLARHIAVRRFAELERIVAKGKRATYALFASIAVLAVAGFPVLLAILEKQEFRDGWLPFAILMLGMTIVSGYAPFQQTLLMANHPAWHTLMMTSIVLFNVVFNALLIPHLGLEGSATATAGCLVFSIFALRTSVRRLVGLRL
jgi:O-antigen/teichoic acid export membrane protein